MVVNFIHALFHRVERGWDPISAKYAREYDERVSREMDLTFVHNLAELSGGLVGKRVLDLGGGPGHFSVLFAQLGAEVIWHDPSREYQNIARRRAEVNQVFLDFSLGYLEDAKKFGENSFDLIFCRVSWYYCRSDRAFGRLVYSLLRPGGIGYIESNIANLSRQTGVRRLQTWMNKSLWFKIGHPFPPRGRIEKLVRRFPVTFVKTDYCSQEKDVVIFQKSQSGLS
jgi:2-polyprenyl-3-methyl-5-hydroxy-6-metoxy-1,4-benzoquinol methylase